LLKIIDIAGKSKAERELYFGGEKGAKGIPFYKLIFLRPAVRKATGGGGR
jgi:hypothetical protein